MKTQNQPFFLNHNDQIPAYQQMDEKQIKEYEHYFNYLHFNINNQSKNNYYTTPLVPPPTPPILAFSHLALSPPPTPFNLPFSYIASTPPPTPVTLAFSHLAFPTTDPLSPLQNNNIVNGIYETPQKTYAGEEASIWGPGQLGLFTKTPDQLDTFSYQPEMVPSSIQINEKKPNPNQPDDTTWLQASSLPSANSPPVFENKCQLGFFTNKKPNQIDTYLNTTHKSPCYQLAQNKPKIVQVRDATKLYVSSISSPNPPPGFEHRCLSSG